MTSANATRGKILCADVELRLTGERTLLLAIPGADVITLTTISDIEKKTKRREVIRALAKACDQDYDELWGDPDVHEEVVRAVHELAARLGVVAPKPSKDGWKERFLATYREFMRGKGLSEEPYTIEYGDEWYVAYHDGHLMAVIKPEVKASGDGGERIVVKPVYVGPIVKQAGDRYAVYLDGRLLGLVANVEELIELLKATPMRGMRIEHPHPEYPYFDVRIPHDDVLRNIVNTAKWQTRITGIIDWAQGVDQHGVLRRDMIPQEAAKALERRAEVIKKYLGINADVALALTAWYLTRPLADVVQPGKTKPVRHFIYLFGPPRRGKSTFLVNLAEMYVPCVEDGSPLCAKFGVPQFDYLVYGAYHNLSIPQARNIAEMEGPPAIIDEVRASAVAPVLSNALGFATARRVGVHAARHGHGIIEFRVRRGLLFASNDPFEKVLRFIQADDSAWARDAVRRRVIVLRWEDHEMKEEEFNAYFKELYEATPAAPPLIAYMLQNAKSELEGWTSDIDLAKRLFKAIEKRFGVNLSAYVEALDKLKDELSRSAENELEDAWMALYNAIRMKYQVSTAWGALAKLISDPEFVYHQVKIRKDGKWRPARPLWRNVFRYSVDVEIENLGDHEVTRIELERRVAYGLFGWDWPQELYNAFNKVASAMEAAGYGDVAQQVDTSVLRRMHDEWLRSNSAHVEQIELIKTVERLIKEGKYPKLLTKAAGVSSRKYLGAPIEHIKGEIYVYDVIPQFFKYVLGDVEESQEDEEISNSESEDVKSKALSQHPVNPNKSSTYTEDDLATPVTKDVHVGVDISQNEQKTVLNNVQGEIAKSPSAEGGNPRWDGRDVGITLNALQTERGNGAAGQTSSATGGESSQGDTDVKNADEALRVVLEWARKRNEKEGGEGGA